MQSIDILIADDEKPARKKIRSYLKDKDEIAIIMEAGDGVEAANLLVEQKPDLVFLDIQMPGMNGFEVIESVGVENMPVVVFVTAYDEFALNAFEVHAVDYLLKPYDSDRFQTAFKRALQRIRMQSDNAILFRNLVAELNKERKYLSRILVNFASRFFFIKTSEILFISSEEKYVKLHTENEIYLIRDTMTRLEKRLDPGKFARIHRSHIVNIDFVKEMQPWSHGDYVAILKNGTRLTISRRFRSSLFDKI